MQQMLAGRDQTPSPPIHLTELAGYETFGDYLVTKRTQLELTQEALMERINAYLLQDKKPTLSILMYGSMERRVGKDRNRRAPQVFELLPIFRALVSFHSDKLLPPIVEIEAQTYFNLARKHIDGKKRKNPHLSSEDWEKILQELMTMVDHRKPG